MVVSPKEVKFEPKDGDLVVDTLGGIHIMQNSTTSYCYFDRLGILDKTTTTCVRVDRHATEEEKKRLFDKLAEEGLEWDAEKKQIVKLKWKPKCKEPYFRITLEHAVIIPYLIYWKDDIRDNAYYQKGWCFKTKEECQEFCNRLNKAMESVKP